MIWHYDCNMIHKETSLINDVTKDKAKTITKIAKNQFADE